MTDRRKQIATAAGRIIRIAATAARAGHVREAWQWASQAVALANLAQRADLAREADVVLQALTESRGSE